VITSPKPTSICIVTLVYPGLPGNRSRIPSQSTSSAIVYAVTVGVRDGNAACFLCLQRHAFRPQATFDSASAGSLRHANPLPAQPLARSFDSSPGPPTPDQRHAPKQLRRGRS
jgi:hypothetical protein